MYIRLFFSSETAEPQRPIACMFQY
ncbi:hypothetical protein OF001_U220073 [Pseudomonas sp. OF001]|nr:hypothetical protein OF001_U220073 [Pseudomonas sp. OF001]